MKDWFRLLKQHPVLLSYGFFLNFFSSFGQTFFVALLVPFWVRDLELTNAGFGSMYGVISVVSALTLPVFGRYIDTLPLRRFSRGVFLGLTVAVLVLLVAQSPVFLMVGLFLVRFFGQGLMTHTASTGIAKLFEKRRGKALAFTSMGHPFAQFLLPLLFAFLAAWLNWRLSLLLMIGTAFLLMWPLMAKVPSEKPYVAGPLNTGQDKQGRHFMLTRRFWLVASNVFLIPFLNTAIMLYQYAIAAEKGWDASWVVFSFSMFAVFNGVSLFFSGNLIDRFTGLRLFPLYLLPALLGFVGMVFIDDRWIFPVFYALLGVSTGLGSTIKTAVQAELYGTAQLGQLKSYLSTMVVLGTAVGPPILGFMLDATIRVEHIMLSAAILLLLVTLSTLTIKK